MKFFTKKYRSWASEPRSQGKAKNFSGNTDGRECATLENIEPRLTFVRSSGENVCSYLK
jgi:hypothetical protein